MVVLLQLLQGNSSSRGELLVVNDRQGSLEEQQSARGVRKQGSRDPEATQYECDCT